MFFVLTTLHGNNVKKELKKVKALKFKLDYNIKNPQTIEVTFTLTQQFKQLACLFTANKQSREFLNYDVLNRSESPKEGLVIPEVKFCFKNHVTIVL